MPEHRQLDACFVIIMTHGTSLNGKDYLFSCDEFVIDTDDVLAEFNNKNSPVLFGKPKVFLFQSCRGDEPDAGVPVAYGVQPSESSSTLETDGGGPAAGRVPTWTDMLIVHSTVPGEYSSPRSFMMPYKQGWEVEGLGPRFNVLRFAFLGGKRFEVQGSTCQENFFKA